VDFIGVLESFTKFIEFIGSLDSFTSSKVVTSPISSELVFLTLEVSVLFIELVFLGLLSSGCFLKHFSSVWLSKLQKEHFFYLNIALFKFFLGFFIYNAISILS